jgi:hypothetical protein
MQYVKSIKLDLFVITVFDGCPVIKEGHPMAAYRVPVEATCAGRSGATSKMEKVWEFENVPAKDEKMYDVGEGYFFVISRVEDNESGYPKRVYTNVDQQTFAAMRRNGWQPA